MRPSTRLQGDLPLNDRPFPCKGNHFFMLIADFTVSADLMEPGIDHQQRCFNFNLGVTLPEPV
jgi:hypothetical protein